MSFCCKIIFTTLALYIPIFSFAQNATRVSADSVKSTIIPIENIALFSVEKIGEINKMDEALITDMQLNEEKARNDSILTLVDSMFVITASGELDSLNARGLDNLQSVVTKYQDILRKEEKRLQGIVQTLYAQSSTIRNDLKLWKETREFYATEYPDSALNSYIEQVIAQADSFNQKLLDRTTKALVLVANTSKYSIKAEEQLAAIEAVEDSRQQKLLVKQYPPIYKINMFDFSELAFGKYFSEYFGRNKQVLRDYYNQNKDRFFYYLLFLAALIGVLLNIKKRSKHILLGKLNIYQASALQILRRPVSLAFIFWIYTSKLFFPLQPPVLIDLSILILLVPVLDILMHLSKGGRKFLAVFALLFLLRFTNYMFPPVSTMNRYLLIAMGVIELIFLMQLKKSINLKSFTNLTFSKFVNLIIFVHLGSAAVGLMAGFSGHLRIAEIAIDLPVTNTLVGILLVFFSVTLIGFIQLFIDRKHTQKINFIKKRREVLKSSVVYIVMLIAALFWINYILLILQVNRKVYHFLDTIMTYDISLGNLSFTMWKILLFFFIIWLSVIISGGIRMVLEEDVLKKAKLKKGVPRMISVVARFSLITIGIILAVSAVGMPLNQITIIFSAFSVGIGFGLQNVVNNFVSGIILLFERPVQIGDTVEVGALVGTVKSMGIRSSNVRTFDGAEVVVPNANLISNEVINWTLSDRKRRIEIISGVAYGSDVHKVQKLLFEVLAKHPDILKDPEPLVLFNDLGESSLDFRLLFWTENFDNWIIIKSEIIFLIHDTLYREGISIPFPQRDLHIISHTKVSDAENMNDSNKTPGEESL